MFCCCLFAVSRDELLAFGRSLRNTYAELKGPEGPNIQLVTLVKLTTLIRIYDAELRINTLSIINNSVSTEVDAISPDKLGV